MRLLLDRSFLPISSKKEDMQVHVNVECQFGKIMPTLVWRGLRTMVRPLFTFTRVDIDASNQDYLEEVEMEVEQLLYEWEQIRREGERAMHLKLGVFDLDLRTQLLLLHGDHAPRDVHLSSAAKNLESYLAFPSPVPEELLKQVDGGTQRLFPANVETSKEMPVPSSACNELFAKDLKEWRMMWMWMDDSGFCERSTDILDDFCVKDQNVVDSCSSLAL
jgi:hypothetical protein